jgi:uncharacterized protein YxjI
LNLYLKQKVFSWRDRFNVMNAAGTALYSVEGELFSWGKKLHIYGPDGQEVAFIRQKVMALFPRFYIEMGGRVVCEIVKEFSFFHPKYRLEGIPWRMDGDFFDHEYTLHDGKYEIMRLSKKWFSWGDSYELNIHDPRNELICLCVALAVDCALAAAKG